MEVVADAVDDDGVAGIVAAGAACADVDALAEDVDQLALAFVAPLGPKHHGGHGYLFCYLRSLTFQLGFGWLVYWCRSCVFGWLRFFLFDLDSRQPAKAWGGGGGRGESNAGLLGEQRQRAEREGEREGEREREGEKEKERERVIKRVKIELS